jgi:diacylglycerol kinase family enzyme
MRAVMPGLQCAFTERAGHATQLVRTALEQGVELIISVGGDGTNNEVLAGFVDATGVNRFPSAELALIPAGRGSDFTRTFGPPVFEQWISRLKLPARATDYGIARSFGNGQVQVRTFLNEASTGASSQVLAYANAAQGKLGPTLTYLVSSVRGITSHRNHSVWIRYDDAEPELIPMTLVGIANGQYFGAGMWLNPNGSVEDGQFDVIEASGMSRMKLMEALGRLYFGKHLSLSKVRHRRCKRLTLWSEAEDAPAVGVETDGELGVCLPVTFEIAPGGILIRGLSALSA